MSNQNKEFMGQKFEDIIVTLPFEDGSSMECGVYAYFQVRGKEYFALLPLKGKKQLDFSHKFMLYEVQKDAENNPVVMHITNDAEFESAANYFSLFYS